MEPYQSGIVRLAISVRHCARPKLLTWLPERNCAESLNMGRALYGGLVRFWPDRRRQESPVVRVGGGD